MRAALVLVGFVAAALLLRPLTPDGDGTDQELSRALAERDRCQVLFAGPSYVRTQFLPEAFNEEARAIGLGLEACKFGRAGLRGYELKRELERLLSHDWPKLELVVVDVTLGHRIEFEPDNWFKARLIAWHPPSAVPWLYRYYQRERRPWSKTLPVVLAHARHALANAAGLGRGIELMSQIFGRSAEPRTARPREPKRDPRHAARLRRLERQKRRRSEHHASSDWPVELRETVRSFGKEAYFLYAPIWSAKTTPRAAVRGSDRLVLLDFNDPKRFPELYTPEARGRTAHLSRDARPTYSRLLARELLRVRNAVH